MRRKTSEDYFRELNTWYEQHRETLHAGLLVEPSNGDLRNLCLKLFRDGLSVADDEVFRSFFEVGKTDDLQRAISNVDIEKFRPIVNSLKGVSKTRDRAKLNLIAVLVDFPKRPLPVFLQDDAPNAVNSLSPDYKKPPVKSENDQPGNHKRLKYGLAGLGLTIIVMAAFLVGNSSVENCMAWKEDHYVSISCQDTVIAQLSKEPLDKKQFGLMKISVSKGTKFFIDGKPQVWYLKHAGEYEFFNQPGYHPVYREKKLKPVTTYIAMRVATGE